MYRDHMTLVTTALASCLQRLCILSVRVANVVKFETWRSVAMVTCSGAASGVVCHTCILWHETVINSEDKSLIRPSIRPSVARDVRHRRFTGSSCAIVHKPLAAQQLPVPTWHRSKSVLRFTVSKIGDSALFFVQPGVKVNGQYYVKVLLSQQILSAIKHVQGDNFVKFIFKHGSAWGTRYHPPAPARYSQHHFSCVWRSNSSDLNTVDYKTSEVIQQRVYETQVNKIDELKQRPVDVSTACSAA